MAIDIHGDRDASSAVQAAVMRHGTDPEALIPILAEINQALGHLPAEALAELSELLQRPASAIHSVATFYHLFSSTPRGRHVIQFCESAPCHVVCGRKVWEALQDELGLQPGETSSDGRWTLVTTSCLGICGVGPVLVIDDDMYGNLQPERVPEILARYT